MASHRSGFGSLALAAGTTSALLATPCPCAEHALRKRSRIDSSQSTEQKPSTGRSLGPGVQCCDARRAQPPHWEAHAAAMSQPARHVRQALDGSTSALGKRPQALAQRQAPGPPQARLETRLAPPCSYAAPPARQAPGGSSGALSSSGGRAARGGGAGGRRGAPTLRDLVDAGVTAPGRNNITVVYKGVTYTASLGREGLILYQGAPTSPPGSVHGLLQDQRVVPQPMITEASRVSGVCALL